MEMSFLYWLLKTVYNLFKFMQISKYSFNFTFLNTEKKSVMYSWQMKEKAIMSLRWEASQGPSPFPDLPVKNAESARKWLRSYCGWVNFGKNSGTF